MLSRWNDAEAAKYSGPLGPRIYSSRLLGQEPSLVLHGGGNTSVKLLEKDLYGDEESILYVKGSGWDLEYIEAAGFAPVRLNPLLKLATLEQLSDERMVNELRGHMTRADAPTPSVEAILHAILPYRYVDHTHTSALLSITNTPNGAARIREIYGDSVVVIPYIMPGFDLARLCAEGFPRDVGPNTIGMVLMNHGLFSFADDPRESYENMIKLVSQAEDYLRQQDAWEVEISDNREQPHDRESATALAKLRLAISQAAKSPMLLPSYSTPRIRHFIARKDSQQISQQGPATPDHIIRTKQLPLLGHDVAGYAENYRRYFVQHSAPADTKLEMLDPAPRVILDPEFGLCTAGTSMANALIVRDLYEETMNVIERAEHLDKYQALASPELFAVEYWELEQAKLRSGGSPPQFSGEIALVSGAASGIGRATVKALLTRGAAVIGIDIAPEIHTVSKQSAFLGIQCDLRESEQLSKALYQGVHHFGGLDMLFLNAGIFPESHAIHELPDTVWQQSMAINVDANLSLLRTSHPLLCLSPSGGRVLIIGSKNVPAPGLGAAAYSAAKAALNQLGRIAALEWAPDNIRVNLLHPDAVFDTGIWTTEVLEKRADAHQMSVAEYKRRNLLGVEISSHDVAELAVEMCGPLFAKTTGAQLPIDGGSDRII